MNSKFLNCEEGKIKIDNLKNITLSDIINKKKKYKGFREGRDIQIFNQKLKHSNNNNNIINNNLDIFNSKIQDNTISRISTNQINKNAKIAKLSLDLFADKPYKLKEEQFKKKLRKYNLNSNRNFYPKKYLKMISYLSESNYKNKKRERKLSFNRSKKEQLNLFKKILNNNKTSIYDGVIPLMNFEKSKRKKKLGNKTLKEKSIKNINDISNNTNKNISFNQYSNYSNNNIVSKPQCLYKGPLKYDISVGEDDIARQNNQSLFKTFMSRNLKPSKPEINNYLMELSNKDSQACTFIRYDANGTMRTKRIFNSTFHIYDNNDTINKEIVTTINNNNMVGGGNNNKKKRIFGGIMMGNKAKLF